MTEEGSLSHAEFLSFLNYEDLAQNFIENRQLDFH